VKEKGHWGGYGKGTSSTTGPPGTKRQRRTVLSGAENDHILAHSPKSSPTTKLSSGSRSEIKREGPPKRGGTVPRRGISVSCRGRRSQGGGGHIETDRGEGFVNQRGEKGCTGKKGIFYPEGSAMGGVLLARRQVLKGTEETVRRGSSIIAGGNNPYGVRGRQSTSPFSKRKRVPKYGLPFPG